MWVNLCGSTVIEIVTEPVFVLSMGIQVTEDEFFDPQNIVNSIAGLLNIAPNRIVVMNAVSESRRKKRSAGETNIDVSHIFDNKSCFQIRL